jgi:putative ABC transport system permease protein
VATEGVAVARVAAAAKSTSAQRRQAVLEVTDALARMRGVRSVGAASKIPLTGNGDNWGMQVVGRQPSELPSQTTAFRIVTRDYFATLGIELRKGRLFEPSDRLGSEYVVVINEELARTFFPDEDPIGRYVQTGFGTQERIIGVVATAAETNLTDEPQPARYMLYDQLPYTGEMNSFVVRVAPGRDADAVLDEMRRTINATVPTVAVQELTTMERVFQAALGPVRQVMSLLTLLTALALILGAIGVYGVMSHFASRRQRDWGIQIALGMLPARVVTRVLRHGAVLVGTGLAIGLVAVLGLRRVVGSLLYGVEATDPLSILSAMGALVAVGFVAAWLPARRASRTDPAIVLREQ